MPAFPVHTAPEIRAAVGVDDLLEPVAEALAAFSTVEGARAPISVLPLKNGGDAHLKAAYLPGMPHFVVKVATWFPANRALGLPEGGGFVALLDARTGTVTAVLEDEHHLSDLRTAAAGAVSARALARPDASRVTVMGTGRQARLQAHALTRVRGIDHVTVWGRTPEGAARLVGQLREDLPDLPVEAVADPEAAVRDADVIITATAGTSPVLRGDWLRPGQHITALGADDEHKRELDAGVFARATRIFVDGRDLNLRYGDVHAAVAAGEITPDRITGELGEVLSGRTPGRRTSSDITLAKLIGIGPQDLAAAETAVALLTP
ncbi:ornithine cyclodeaminase [Actinocorallia herbida]|uniref:Ornithine cyclodeaminase n=1 Tax=Actinocorallia herbida TaxID=58109 RepID=A0A3N1D672_9ACTN|nr:ornithine cyclodeaminase family protein [Actinocorallia herbida]ROO89041.1 ornithine cyclodeaminase [Actinocorallia herbida]